MHKTIVRMGLLAILTVLLPVAGFAFTVTNNGGNTVDGKVGMSLTNQQAVQLTISGAASGSGEPTTLTEPGGGGRNGDVDFGIVNTINSTPTTGKQIRLSANNGARFVATLSALPETTGFANGADIDICRSDALGSVPTGRVRWATGNNTDWSVAAAGTLLSENCLAKNSLANNQASGSAVTHEFALEIVDTDTTGAKTVEVTYTITGAP